MFDISKTDTRGGRPLYLFFSGHLISNQNSKYGASSEQQDSNHRISSTVSTPANHVGSS
jgi:hypothetical protein